MSNQINDSLLERAAEMVSEYEGTDMELAINKAIAENDLERLEYLTAQAEHETAIQEFHNYDQIP